MKAETEASGGQTASSSHPGSVNPNLITHEVVHGRKPGDQMVRTSRHPLFREVEPGVLVPRPKATEPQAGLSRAMWRAKRFAVGQPIPTDQEQYERLTKVKALAVFSSDALSSVAYATEATMRVLLLAGIGALALTMPISLAIVLLLVIVVASYQQTVRAYPSGGGAYIVARQNLGDLPGLVAAAALLADYVLTVAVSVAAGVAALTSAFPELLAIQVEIALAAVALLMIANLRGVRESGTIFATPTYVFVLSICAVIALGLWRLATGGLDYVPPTADVVGASQPLTWFLVLSAFAKGCAALTGTEAISNGVPAFKAPESHNARLTLIWMGLLLGSMFLGISFLASYIGLVPAADESETVLSQLTKLVVGESWFYYLVQFATAVILFLAANTSYADFPRLLSILARDRFAPRWFGLRGDRLAFSAGILTLTVLSALLLAVFGSRVDHLLPLYAVGVFTSFTLSQAGMVVHWWRSQDPHRRRSIAVNGLGAVATALVTLIIGGTKFLEGAWLVVLVWVLLVAVFDRVHRHYLSVAQQLRDTGEFEPLGEPLVLVPVASLSRAARLALAFAHGVGDQVVAVHVGTDPLEEEKVRRQWQQLTTGVPLVVIESPYRLLLPPLLAYVDTLRAANPDRPLLVLLPEFVPKHWWEHVLHNQTALRLKASLLFRHGVVVASVPYHLSG